MKKKLAYIAGPYRAGTNIEILENIASAYKVAMEYWKKGYAVICPHTNAAFLEGLVPEQDFLDGCLEIISRMDPKNADVLVLAPGWKESTGTLEEFRLAREMGLVVHFYGEK